ncbi:hypothetical protein KP509_07G002000 [Ceratopteris richardii]|uniref:Uncharacterized protein n=1 Tax=Ceratopteris richardii TaxID=49495 RepID=A0A8T2UDW7_CERRI|nr:hypothetical protein KP509_07G002000 [Ceratopteris richardii]
MHLKCFLFCQVLLLNIRVPHNLYLEYNAFMKMCENPLLSFLLIQARRFHRDPIDFPCFLTFVSS